MHSEVTDDLRNRLTLYALGMLEGDDADSLAWHLDQGCPVCDRELRTMRETLFAVAQAGPLVRPRAGLRDRVMAVATPRAPHIVRQNEGEWQRLANGIWAKLLFADHAVERVTRLVRMAPGASFGEHRQSAPEQCLVLEGEVREREHVLRRGDYLWSPAGSEHAVEAGPEGCLLLIVSSGRDEVYS